MRFFNIIKIFSAILSQETKAAPTIETHALESRQSDCRSRLGCSYGYIEQQPYQWRRDYLQRMQSSYLNQYNSGSQFRNFEGLLSVVIQLRIGSRDTWYSGVNAGLIEAIQNGIALTVGFTNSDGGNRGARLYADFFRKMRSGGYTERNQHDYDWSRCEEVSTEYGRQMADRRYIPTNNENSCYKSQQEYRFVMRNRSSCLEIIRVNLSIKDVLSGLLGTVQSVLTTATTLLGWMTDVGKQDAGYEYYSTATDYYNSGGPNTSPSDVLRRLVPGLLAEYKD